MPRRGRLTAPAACLAAGAAVAFTLPPVGLCWLGWFAPAVLLHSAARAESARGAGGLGFAFGAGFLGVALHWIYQTCRFAGMPMAASLVAWGALTAVLALNWALYAACGRAWLGSVPELARPWAWALLWTALEHASSRWTPRLGGDLMAHTQWRHLSLVQVGAFAGPHALGLLVMAVNGSLALFVERRTRHALAGVCFAAATAVLASAWGLVELGRRPPPPPAGPAAVVLQPNVDQYRKWDEGFAGDIRRTFEGLLARPVPPGSLVVWPESALPGWLDDPENAEWMRARAAAAGTPMVVGAVAHIGAKRHNAAVLMTPAGEAGGLYAKRRLVPFGEFVPMRALLQPFIGILSELGDFDAGAPEQPLLPTPLGPAAVTLCYEAVFPRLTLSDAQRGARVFLNLTNDGWYKDTWGPSQHMATNVYRAVEARAAVVRAANTGISAVIDPWGVVLASAPVMTAGRLDVPLPAADPFPRRSFYVRTGDWLGLGALFAAALVWLRAAGSALLLRAARSALLLLSAARRRA